MARQDGHELARNLYRTGLDAAERQGAIPENEIVKAICTQGLVAETQTLIDIAASKES